MNFSIITLGCKVNQYESEAITQLLLNNNYQYCENPDNAKLIIINSCTVTKVSDNKTKKILHKLKRNNKDAIIVLTGCIPQAFPNLIDKFNEADIILGNSNRLNIISSIEQYLKTNKKIINILPYTKNSSFEKLSVNKFYNKTRAILKIEDGCNRFCSYCIIPYARGKVRSKPIEKIKSEACNLAKNGYKEIVLVGINLSSFGSDINLNLCDAIETVCEIENIKRVRLGSLEPDEMNLETIKRLSKQKKLCPHFHLSLQSGCDKTLKRMNRHYTAEQYYNIIQNIRNNFENSAITTDIMVGFPGETESEFEESMNFVKKINFSKVHVFPYSIRPGTKAANEPNQITQKEKKERVKKMISATNICRHEFLYSQIGKTESVIFETKNKDGFYEGYTKNYTPVKVQSSVDLRHEEKNIKILSSNDEYCIGKCI